VKNGCGVPPKAEITAFTGPSDLNPTPQAMLDPTMGTVAGIKTNVRHNPRKGIVRVMAKETTRAIAIWRGLITRLNAIVLTIISINAGFSKSLT
jgi:hypothetical protein